MTRQQGWRPRMWDVRTRAGFHLRPGLMADVMVAILGDEPAGPACLTGVGADGGPPMPAAAAGGAQHDLRLLLEERERMAGELFELINSLFGIGLGLQGAAGLLTDRQVAGRLETCIAELDDCIRRLREQIFDLVAPSRAAV